MKSILRHFAPLPLGLCVAVVVNLANVSAQVPAAAPPVVDDPAVQALLATNPQTPEDLLNTALLLVDLKYPQVAKPLFDQLLTTAVEPEQLAALGRSAGIAKLNRLTTVKEFQPQAADFVKRVIAATNAANRDPARLAELIERLKQPNTQVQAAAVVALRSGGDAAAQALVDVLLDPARASEHKTISTALAGLGGEGAGPLAVLAVNGSEAQRLIALDALGYVETDATPPGVVEAPLFAAAFGEQSSPEVRRAAEAAVVRRRGALPKQIEAAAELYLQAKHAYFTKPFDLDGTGNAAIWTWDASAKKPARVTVPRAAESFAEAALLARTAAELSANDAAALQLARAASLENALVAQNAQALKAWVAEKPSVAELEKLLDFAIANDRTSAAIALVDILAAASGSAALDSVGGKPAPLVRAVQSADRRIRFAALQQILKLDPKVPFAGSSGVNDALGYFAAGSGARKALVVDAHPTRGRDVAGILAGLGYQVDAVPDARSAVRRAAADPDLELVLMYRTMVDPALGQLLAQFRADYRTARLPVAVYCEPNDVERMRSAVRNDMFATAIYQPRMVDTLKLQLAELEAAAVAALPSAAERVTEAQAALTAIGRLVDVRSKVFNARQFEPVLLTAAWNSLVGKQALGALGYLGSPAAQRTLADVASANALPLELRQEATKAFCESVIRFGTLLTTTEVLRQYDRYNAAEKLDRATQELLAAILDAVEARAAKVPTGRAASASSPQPEEASKPAGESISAPAVVPAVPTVPAAP
ncbi:MAG: hypothetical protein JNL96_21965 [Planctomycetaceae bacterium]|nr:hypothetical protein [Planctomycetaceae bacterium]